jgi:hypothetical protein
MSTTLIFNSIPITNVVPPTRRNNQGFCLPLIIEMLKLVAIKQRCPLNSPWIIVPNNIRLVDSTAALHTKCCCVSAKHQHIYKMQLD